jgi:hypothetical protein
MRARFRVAVVGVWIIALALVAIATSSVYSTFIEEEEPTTHELVMEWEACNSRVYQILFGINERTESTRNLGQRYENDFGSYVYDFGFFYELFRLGEFPELPLRERTAVEEVTDQLLDVCGERPER